jgi:hypothetical protein
MRMSGRENERMESKPARLTVLIDTQKKKAFEALCAERDITASQALRQLIRDYLDRHGVTQDQRAAIGRRR